MNLLSKHSLSLAITTPGDTARKPPDAKWIWKTNLNYVLERCNASSVTVKQQCGYCWRNAQKMSWIQKWPFFCTKCHLWERGSLCWCCDLRALFLKSENGILVWDPTRERQQTIQDKKECLRDSATDEKEEILAFLLPSKLNQLKNKTRVSRSKQTVIFITNKG